MSIEHPSDERQSAEVQTTLSPTEQRRKASQLLLGLQWLLILVSLAMTLWLYVTQKRFEQEMATRLQSSDQISSRLNEMDDRLHAISQRNVPTASSSAGGQAQNQMDMLRLQLQAAERLLEDDRYNDGIALLRGLLWQLSQDNNEIAPALTIVLKQSLERDIEELQAQSAQPSAWQIHNLAIADIQGFLRDEVSHSGALAESAAAGNSPLAARDIVLHETIMTLNLAMQASNMRDRSLLLMYLEQAKEQLKTLQAPVNNPARPSSHKPIVPEATAHSHSSSDFSASSNANANGNSNSSKPANSIASATDATLTPKARSAQPDPVTAQRPVTLLSLQDAINWLDKLIAAPPSQSPLLTAQVLDSKSTQPQ